MRVFQVGLVGAGTEHPDTWPDVQRGSRTTTEHCSHILHHSVLGIRGKQRKKKIPEIWEFYTFSFAH